MLAKWLFRRALHTCGLSREASRWLALYANQHGDYSTAILHLCGTLSVVPEDRINRLNLVANIIFRDGYFSEEAQSHARAALFHGGPDMVSRLYTQLSNTTERDALVATMTALRDSVEAERLRWLERREKVRAPEPHGGIVHVELS